MFISNDKLDELIQHLSQPSFIFGAWNPDQGFVVKEGLFETLDALKELRIRRQYVNGISKQVYYSVPWDTPCVEALKGEKECGEIRTLGRCEKCWRRFLEADEGEGVTDGRAD